MKPSKHLQPSMQIMGHITSVGSLQVFPQKPPQDEYTMLAPHAPARKNDILWKRVDTE